MGTVDVYLDNAFQATVDLRASGARQVQQVVWQKSGLTRASTPSASSTAARRSA